MHKLNNTSTQKYKTTFLVVYIIFIIDLSISVMVIAAAVVNTLPNGMLQTEGTAAWFDLTTQQLAFNKASNCL